MSPGWTRASKARLKAFEAGQIADAERMLLGCPHDMSSITEVNGRPRWVCTTCNQPVPRSHWLGKR